MQAFLDSDPLLHCITTVAEEVLLLSSTSSGYCPLKQQGDAVTIKADHVNFIKHELHMKS